MQRGNREYQKQALQGFRGRQFIRLDLKAPRFIVQEVLFDVKPQPELVQGVQVGWFITDDVPGISGLIGWAGQREMHRADGAAKERDLVVEMGMPQRRA